MKQNFGKAMKMFHWSKSGLFPDSHFPVSAWRRVVCNAKCAFFTLQAETFTSPVSRQQYH